MVKSLEKLTVVGNNVFDSNKRLVTVEPVGLPCLLDVERDISDDDIFKKAPDNADAYTHSEISRYWVSTLLIPDLQMYFRAVYGVNTLISDFRIMAVQYWKKK